MNTFPGSFEVFLSLCLICRDVRLNNAEKQRLNALWFCYNAWPTCRKWPQNWPNLEVVDNCSEKRETAVDHLDRRTPSTVFIQLE